MRPDPAFGRSYQAVLATAYAFDGQLDDARSILTTFSSTTSGMVRRNQLWLTDMTSLAETADISATEPPPAARRLGRRRLVLRGFRGHIWPRS